MGRFRNRSVDDGDLPYFTTLFTLCSPHPLPDISVPRGRPSWANKKADSAIRSRLQSVSVCTFFAERGWECERVCVCTHRPLAAAEVDAAAATVALRLSFFTALLRRIRSR